MDGSSKVPRRVPVKIGPALVAAGVLLVGLAACGSDSSSDSTGSTSAVPEKEAGIGGVNLRVINQSPAEITVSICGDGGRCRPATLSPAESDALAAEGVSGSIEFPDGDRVAFDAQNPIIGRPYVTLRSGNESERLDLSEGENAQLELNGRSFVASRETDSDVYKQMTLEVGE